MTTQALRSSFIPTSSRIEEPASPLFIPSVDDPNVAKPVILTSFDSLPSPMGTISPNSCYSPTSIYISVPEEHSEVLGEKRKRQVSDDLYNLSISKSAGISSLLDLALVIFLFLFTNYCYLLYSL